MTLSTMPTRSRFIPFRSLCTCLPSRHSPYLLRLSFSTPKMVLSCIPFFSASSLFFVNPVFILPTPGISLALRSTYLYFSGAAQGRGIHLSLELGWTVLGFRENGFFNCNLNQIVMGHISAIICVFNSPAGANGSVAYLPTFPCILHKYDSASRFM
jgi:hypothetical protein